MKEIRIRDNLELLIKIIIIISFVSIGPLLMHKYEIKNALINALITLVVSILVFRKTDIKKVSKKKLIISLLIGAYVDTLLISLSTIRFYRIIDSIIVYINKGYINQTVPYILAVLSYPAIVFSIYYWLDKHHPKVVKEVKTINKNEKKYLLIVGLISLVLVTFTSMFSTAFLETTHNNEAIVDVIYTSDNGTILGSDAWFYIAHSENDIRQPLYGIFSLPFSIPAHLISELIFFVPKDISYGLTLSIIQFLLLALTVIMLARLLKLEEKEKKYFYLLFSLSFPYILFGLIIEQYVIALFYLILTIYQFDKLKNNINYSYLGGVSTLITTGIIFPLITKAKGFKNKINDYKDCFIKFIIIFVLGGQIDQIITINEKMDFLMSHFVSKQTLIDKIYKYTYFVESLFKITPGHVEKFLSYDSYRMFEPTTISIFGLIIIGLVIISFILNRKNKLAIISFLWIIFSFIILCLVGWGTAENGLVLYSLYFSWAFYILIYLLIKKIFKNKRVFSVVMIIIILVMFIYTSKELINILHFALTYFRR